MEKLFPLMRRVESCMDPRVALNCRLQLTGLPAHQSNDLAESWPSRDRYILDWLVFRLGGAEEGGLLVVGARRKGTKGRPLSTWRDVFF